MADRNVWAYNGYLETSAYAAMEQARLTQMHDAWMAYQGKLPESLVTKKGRPNDNIYVNFCRIIVDKGVSFLFGQDVDFILSDKRDEEEVDDPNEEWLEEVWEYNKKGILLQRLAMNGAVCGHAFLKIVIDGNAPYPKLIVIDPVNVSVVTRDDDYTEVYAYIIQWNGTDRSDPVHPRPAVFRQTISLNDDFKSWNILDEMSTPENASQNRGWTFVQEETWNFDFAPILDCQNLPSANEFWGLSDLEPDIIDLQRALNSSVSNMNRMIRLYAHPKIWSTGLSESQQQQIRIDADGMIHIPGTLGQLHQLDTSSDLGQSIAFYVKLRESLHEQSRVPEVATGKLENVGPLSGAALKILYGPLVEKTEQKRLTYGYLLREANRRLLAIVGRGIDLIPELSWPEIIPQDPLQEAQTAVVWKGMGVSNWTLMERAGFDPKKEAERSARENQAAIETQQKMMQGMMLPSETNAPTEDVNPNPGFNEGGPA